MLTGSLPETAFKGSRSAVSILLGCLTFAAATARAQDLGVAPQARSWSRGAGQSFEFLPLGCPAQPQMQPAAQSNRPGNPFQRPIAQLPTFQNEQARLRYLLSAGGDDLLKDSDGSHARSSGSDDSDLIDMGPTSNKAWDPAHGHC
jgi:hypothetical protein